MAAHLHRYRAEVSMIEENIQRLSAELLPLTSDVRHSAENAVTVDTNNEHWFDAISIRAQGLTRFVAELEMKTQTVIALVSYASRYGYDNANSIVVQYESDVYRSTDCRLERVHAQHHESYTRRGQALTLYGETVSRDGRRYAQGQYIYESG